MIEVKINPADYPLDWHLTDSGYEMWVVGQLRDAGIPVDGFLTFRGVKEGTLTRHKDFETDFDIYRWEK